MNLALEAPHSRLPLAARMLLFVLLLVAAHAVGHYGVYEGLIVPQLPRWQHVPWGYWLLQYAPALAVCLATGLQQRTLQQAAACAALAALTDTAFLVWLWRSEAPGYLKAYEYGPLEALQAFLFDLTLCGLGFAGALVVGRRFRARRRAQP